MINNIGIMQGRLLPPVDGKLQAFPITDWPLEFSFVTDAHLSCIEWIFDVQPLFENPIADRIGRTWLTQIQQQSDVSIRSVCADYFMRQPLLNLDSLETLQTLIKYASELGVSRIVIPFVDQSSINTFWDLDTAAEFLQIGAKFARQYDITLNLETDLIPRTFVTFLEMIGESNVKVNYDSGNSASLGYNPVEEFDAYGSLIDSVHIKDRKFKGESVPLGEGAVDFSALFCLLHRIDYKGDFILQTARGLWGYEVDLAISNKMLIEKFWEKTTWIES